MYLGHRRHRTGHEARHRASLACQGKSLSWFEHAVGAQRGAARTSHGFCDLKMGDLYKQRSLECLHFQVTTAA